MTELEGKEIDKFGGWSGVLDSVVTGNDLTTEQSEAVLANILEGSATPSQMSAFLVALRMKGVTVDELTGLTNAMTAKSEHISRDDVDELIDTCGTGGDRSNTINVSTAAALVAAGAGAKVCKHGNRSASSVCGSADVLEALGVAIELSPDQVSKCIDDAGIGFCLAQKFHPSMRHLAPTRKEIGIRTVFNFLGPLANPAGVKRQVVGVSDQTMAERMLSVLSARGATNAMVVYGNDGLDELSLSEASTVFHLKEGEVQKFEISPKDVGLATAPVDKLRGGDPTTNAKYIRDVLENESGAMRDFVVFNAGAALVVADLAENIADGVRLASKAIADGSAADALDKLIASSNR